MLAERGKELGSDVRDGTEVEGGEHRRCILFPTNFGPAARRAWPYALSVARALAADMVVLHVVELTAADFENPGGMIGVDMIAESLRRACEPALEQLRAEATAGGVPVRTTVVVGRVRQEIARAAVQEHASVVVVATRRRTVMGGLPAMRSVAEWVASHAPCSVWIVSSVAKPGCRLPPRPGEVRDLGYALLGGASDAGAPRVSG